MGLNSDFFFSLTGCLTNAKEIVYPTINPYLEGEEIHALVRSEMQKAAALT